MQHVLKGKAIAALYIWEDSFARVLLQHNSSFIMLSGYFLCANSCRVISRRIGLELCVLDGFGPKNIDLKNRVYQIQHNFGPCFVIIMQGIP